MFYKGSLDSLNKLLKEPLPVNRFRPRNVIIISGHKDKLAKKKNSNQTDLEPKRKPQGRML
ncbi:unnamed protein product [Arabidopsis thaliana]|uniref:Uncharacterized protein n=1 Tax=Arabidopsis thaliana TaxID=3702 RepID=A0A5S9WG55_ARATH|nr:unnamed protein product [Arabidopsis thaliana]